MNLNPLHSSLVRCGLLAAFAVVGFPGQLKAVEIGTAFPSFSGYRFEGEVPKDLAGKVVIVDFWASWCAPCKASFPTLSAVQTEFGSRGLVVLGVSVDEKQGPFEQFKKRLKPTFSTVRETDHRIMSDLSVPTMPTTILVDRTGKVRFVHAGFHDETPARLRQEVLQLLEEKS